MDVILHIYGTAGTNPVVTYLPRDAGSGNPDDQQTKNISLPTEAGQTATVNFPGYGTLTFESHVDPDSEGNSSLTKKPLRFTYSWESESKKFTASSLLPTSQTNHPEYDLVASPRRVSHYFTQPWLYLFKPIIKANETSAESETNVVDIVLDGGKDIRYSFLGDYVFEMPIYNIRTEVKLTEFHFGIISPSVIVRVHDDEHDALKQCVVHDLRWPFLCNHNHLTLCQLTYRDFAAPHAVLPGKVFTGTSYYDSSTIQFNPLAPAQKLKVSIEVPDSQLKPGGPWWYVVDLKAHYRDATFLPLRHPKSGVLLRSKISYERPDPLILRDEESETPSGTTCPYIRQVMLTPADEPPLP